ncbi:TetR/AcrR family transcriptional regulator [Vibrio rarus]|uniref:TetR/AcrR family transcriptional regulator n=1 Tax=Vibrio rarus TaxID=413403 RepID=UPI0021C2D223|nr:TetR/AcrR family transcriptional regulator [Vibrio rarus]
MAPNNKRQDILQAAVTILGRDGFKGLSIQKLATEANVATGTVYLYFKDKDKVIVEVRLWLAKQFSDIIQAGVSSEQPLYERYHTMCENIWNMGQCHLTLLQTQIQYESLPTPLSVEVHNMEKKMFDQLIGLFNEGRESGEIKNLSDIVLYCLSLDSCFALTRKHCQNIEPIDYATYQLAIQASWDAITVK